MHQKKILQLIQSLTEPYTAPYQEHEVSIVLHQWLTKQQIAYKTDTYGNTLVHMRRGHAKQNIAFVAHLDHPSLSVDKIRGERIYCSTLGGMPYKGLKNYPIIFLGTHGEQIHGRVQSSQAKTTQGRTFLKSAIVGVNREEARRLKHGNVGILNIPGFVQHKSRLRLRVADDLLGCVAILTALDDLKHATHDVDVWAVFTRAEEVGFHGTLGFLQNNCIPKNAILVSVECSKAIGEVALGRGPVIRVGDRHGPFHPDVFQLLVHAAKRIKGPTFSYQSAWLTGGTCEATAFSAFGYKAGGIALPLLNYHNQGPHGVEPEEINFHDLINGIKLIVRIVREAALAGSAQSNYKKTLIKTSKAGLSKLQRNHGYYKK